MLQKLILKWNKWRKARRDAAFEKFKEELLSRYEKPPRKATPTRSERLSYERVLSQAFEKAFQVPAKLKQFAMDGAITETHAMDVSPIAKNQNAYFNNILPAQQIMYFANQSFIGYQLCALIAQHWLVIKCLLVPAEDAVRNGYEISINDGTELKPDVLDAITQADIKYKLNANLIEFVYMGRMFGLRIAVPLVEFDTIEEMQEFYKNPFNIDAVKPGSYKGISQIDPYWMTFQLDNAAAGDPLSQNFYEPTWWIINSLYMHHSHLIIFKNEQVADILKPTYYYGGIPTPQKIVERVYAAERCANEAPLLLLTKRTSVIKLDISQPVVNPALFEERMSYFTNVHNNFGVKIIGIDEEYEQFDTTLSDVDVTIMTQYQLVAAAANVPAVKLLGTSPKGFNSTGEYEEAVYHEMLEGIQSRDLAPLIERHHELLIKSEIAPNAPFRTKVTWASLDAMTAKEQAEVNEIKSKTDANLINAGVVTNAEVRERIIKDPDSGFNGLIGTESAVPDVDNTYTDA